MHGGLKVYRGSASAARNYVEADRARTDDYYLVEGTGIADRYVASGQGVDAGGALTGDAYEAWVAGFDPATGAAKGRLRSDDQAVRFVEVVVNGPKSWSLAAALHPGVAAAYDAAQDRAAQQIIGWLAEHATTRVGPRGRQVQVPLQVLEAVTVRHYTSRAGDPHRHLHLQVNARVFAEGRWRGLHTVGVRDSLDAINGIGHAAVVTDPGFRAALTAHGYTVDAVSGEVVELAPYVGPFSARAAQIGRNIDRFEAEWRTVHPGVEPGPRLRRIWDARAWAVARPDKVVPQHGPDLAQRWVEELHALGYCNPLAPAGHEPPATPPTFHGVRPASVRVGRLDRDAAVGTVLARLGARRSAWNAADVRGEVEQWIAGSGLVTDAGVRLELAEDLTARVVAACVPLLPRADGTASSVPEHVRALTSREVLAVEDELVIRLVARNENPPTRSNPPVRRTIGAVPDQGAVEGLDGGQLAVRDALAGSRALVVVEGAAGVGKTTTLTATRAALEARGQRLVVATPTLKAATVAAAETGGPACSAAWLAHQHGFRWDTDGAWIRLRPDDMDSQTGGTYQGPLPQAVLLAGDLLLVDEAGMLDQDTARALLVIADEHHARLALVGDRHQLPAVGRGGVLDLAARWADPGATLVLDTVHRFVDDDYAALTLSMRTGEDPDRVFDVLLTRGDIRIHPSDTERAQAMATIAATPGGPHQPAELAGEVTGGKSGEAGAGRDRDRDRERVLVVADTREQVAGLNATIRDRRVAAGRVDDTNAVTTRKGERIGVGDRVATRRNDHDLDVANRDTWTVTSIGTGSGSATGSHGGLDGCLQVTGRRGARSLPAGYVEQHLELAYAATVYGAQGDTVESAHLLLGEHTGAAAAYVAMTRGRHHNTAHLVAETIADARNQWTATFSRDRADLGPAHAARQAAAEADRYGNHRPLDRVLVDLRQAWSVEDDLRQQLEAAKSWRSRLAPVAALKTSPERVDLADLRATAVLLGDRAAAADARIDHIHGVLTAETDQTTATLHRQWRTQLPAAIADARTVQAGAGPFGLHRARTRRATADLLHWVEVWRPVLPTLPVANDQSATQAVAALLAHPGNPQLEDPLLHKTFTFYARRATERTHPEYHPARRTAETAARGAAQAEAAYDAAARTHHERLAEHGALAFTRDPAGQLADTEQRIIQLTAHLEQAQARVHALGREPTIRALPAERLQTEHDLWRHDRTQQRDAIEQAARTARTRQSAPTSGAHHQLLSAPAPDRGDPGRGVRR